MHITLEVNYGYTSQKPLLCLVLRTTSDRFRGCTQFFWVIKQDVTTRWYQSSCDGRDFFFKFEPAQVNDAFYSSIQIRSKTIRTVEDLFDITLSAMN